MKNLMSSYPNRTHNVIEYEDDDSDEDEENPDQNKFTQNGYYYNYDDSKRHPKKRKLESFVSNSEPDPHRRDIWSEDESFVLLEVWGERFMELGRRSLRGEDWADVTEKVMEMNGFERTEVECRNQLDALTNKYKKEMAKVESGQGSKWVFFKKMDVLLNTRNRGHSGLGCGVDSGEYVFMNPRIYLDRSNAMDEMRDSPGESDEDNEDGGDEEEGEEEGGGEEGRLLAESIQRFGEIYEKMEESKRKQMMELEKMRQDFQREMDLQKKQIVERAQAEIAKIREMDEEEDDTDTSVDDLGD